MLMLIPIENCARTTAGIEASAPARRALQKKCVPKVFIRNHLSSTFVRGSKTFYWKSTAQLAPTDLCMSSPETLNILNWMDHGGCAERLTSEMRMKFSTSKPSAVMELLLNLRCRLTLLLWDTGVSVTSFAHSQI